ncbi:hypothetical protein KP509_04G097500 [Ceratopteris richardii]|uniref:Uncharacterized protein n=1 Tax=Ceratopteris richardii TaxID=49495 RepID=A0A8T2V374_CERRI|nr:hypothetical protein KP509_04G097500 [Ceratopteris richardii]
MCSVNVKKKPEDEHLTVAPEDKDGCFPASVPQLPPSERRNIGLPYRALKLYPWWIPRELAVLRSAVSGGSILFVPVQRHFVDQKRAARYFISSGVYSLPYASLLSVWPITLEMMPFPLSGLTKLVCGVSTVSWVSTDLATHVPATTDDSGIYWRRDKVPTFPSAEGVLAMLQSVA